MIAHFTLGITFSANGRHVYLMRKDHPDLAHHAAGPEGGFTLAPSE